MIVMIMTDHNSVDVWEVMNRTWRRREAHRTYHAYAAVSSSFMLESSFWAHHMVLLCSSKQDRLVCTLLYQLRPACLSLPKSWRGRSKSPSSHPFARQSQACGPEQGQLDLEGQGRSSSVC